MVKLSKSLSFVHPSLYLRSTFASGSLQIRFKSVLRIGGKWDLQGSNIGVRRELLRSDIGIYSRNYIYIQNFYRISLDVLDFLFTFALIMDKILKLHLS